MTAREIADLFFQLELGLIASLKRNLSRHKAWEKEEGFDWEAWQSAKLRDIRRFQKENQKEVAKYAPAIDQEIRQLIEEQYQEGGAEGFFNMNDRRVNALLDEMQTAQKQVEKAALRYMDDVYRKTIRTAALGMATGSMTLQQATDAATKDFLAAGINCVQYKNGRRVNIASYAEMALRTAATRATLMGEAKLRESMDIDTVLVSQYGACSETCLPWQGLVYIDDVWQDYDGPHTPGGTYGVSRNGRQYPLLSVAVKNGLFHPNCRHTLTTWMEGISTRPEPMDKAQIERTSRLEKQQRAMERNVRKLKRLVAGTQDAEQAEIYRKEVRTAQKKLKAFVDENGDALRRDYWRERYDGLPLQQERTWVAGYHVKEPLIEDHGYPNSQSHILNQKDRGKKVFITDIAIDKVHKVIFNGVSDEIANQVQQAHKKLLRFAKEQNDSNEVSCFLDLTNGMQSEFVKGDQTSIDFEASAECYHWIRTKPEKSLMLLHNHPGQSYFSDRDIATFLLNQSIGAMSIVTNQGKVWVISKGNKYNPKAAYDEFYLCLKQFLSNPDEGIDSFLKKEYIHGIERS